MKAHGSLRIPVDDGSDPRGFEALLGAYLEHLAALNYSDSSKVQATVVIRGFAGWCRLRGLERPGQVSRGLVGRYQRWLYQYRRDDGRPLSLSTQQAFLARLAGFYRWLTAQGYLIADPASGLRRPRLAKRLPVDVFSREEMEQILSTPDVDSPLGLRDRAILEVFYSTGIRRKELTDLDLYDLDLERGYLTIRQGKGGKARVVPIGDRAMAWTIRYLEEVRPELVLHAEEWALFLNYKGERISPDGLSGQVRDIIRDSGVRRRRGACHLIRHTCATLMLEGGADVRFIQEMLGHASLETTQLYTQVAIEKLKEIHTATHPAGKLERRGVEDGG